MDIHDFLNAHLSASRATRSEYHLTLGSAIEKLAALPKSAVVTANGGGLSEPHSYRGYYSDLALEPTGEASTAGALLKALKSALGNTFEGYKGGDFVMGPETPLWLAPYGCCGLAIVGLQVSDGAVTLLTKDTDGD